jgi:YlmC/YmxH family sporulation protein
MGDIICEVTFCELRCKEVINIVDGKRLGRIVDIVFDLKSGRILGLVAPGLRGFFHRSEDVFIPWCNVCKIGDDVILTELVPVREHYRGAHTAAADEGDGAHTFNEGEEGS